MKRFVYLDLHKPVTLSVMNQINELRAQVKEGSNAITEIIRQNPVTVVFIFLGYVYK